MFARSSSPAGFPFICNKCSLQQLRSKNSGHDGLAPNANRHSLTAPALKATRRWSSQSHDSARYQAAKLTNRRLISVHGRDAASFLQGITTNSILPEQRTGIYSAFLTAQGRVLNDVFIYPTHYSPSYLDTLPGTVSRTDPGYLIEVDAAEASKLFAHIRRFKLRAKVNIKLLDDGEWNSWSVWDSHAPSLPWQGGADAATSSTQRANQEESIFGVGIGCMDRRAPAMGWREILPSDRSPHVTRDGDGEVSAAEASLEAYTVRRMLKGVPEGQREIWREVALPQESNIDYMGGIDYRKGCYVGQELTIRTHHTGVVRKRILPVQLYDADGEDEPKQLMHREPNITSSKPSLRTPECPALGTEMTTLSTGVEAVRMRKAGKYLDGIGNIGLALCRLDLMTEIKLPAGAPLWRPGLRWQCTWLDEGGARHGPVGVKAFVPDWHPRGRSRVSERLA